jgi:hypothetical protein
LCGRTTTRYKSTTVAESAIQAIPTTRGGAANAANWRQASILPESPNYRTKPTGSVRPSSGTPVRNPGVYERPTNRPTNNRPDVVINRPDININRPTVNRPVFDTIVSNTTINNTTINNNTRIINKHVVNRPVVNNNDQVNDYRPTRPYYPQLHYHWQPSSWSGGYRPAYYNYSYSTVSGGWLSLGGVTLAYVNPFYVRPATSVAVRYDYSQPIRVPDPNYRETRDDLIRSERAIRRFDDAREVFRRGEYGRANDLIDEAIELLPTDPTLHQFRALVLFARERYQEAAVPLYSVLAVSPGWDATTFAKLYDSPERYLAQVAELEKYAAAHPDALEPRFLLAYHDVVKGDLVGAERLLESVRAARPKDRVVPNLLAALRGQAAE